MGHERLLPKRRAKLEQYQNQQTELKNNQAELEDQKIKLGEPKQRDDRDLRKQTIMTFRSLWLENALHAFFALISTLLTAPLDFEIALELFFFRSGFLVESGLNCSIFWTTKTYHPHIRIFCASSLLVSTNVYFYTEENGCK